MKQLKFENGDKIVIIRDGELRKGVVKNFYELNPPILSIEFEDGSVEKVFASDVAAEPKIEPPEKKREPAEKSEITITPDEFREIATRAIAENTNEYKVSALAYAYATLIGRIHRDLFFES